MRKFFTIVIILVLATVFASTVSADTTGEVENYEIVLLDVEGEEAHRGHFTGRLENGIPEGLGVLRLGYIEDLGEVTYVGYFENGMFHGGGEFHSDDVPYFVGEFKYGDRYRGKRTYEDGATFEGYFENNRPSSGIFIWANGRSFDGDFKDGQLHHGTLTYADGEEFEFFVGYFYDRRPWQGVTHSSGGITFEVVDGELVTPIGEILRIVGGVATVIAIIVSFAVRAKRKKNRGEFEPTNTPTFGGETEWSSEEVQTVEPSENQTFQNEQNPFDVPSLEENSAPAVGQNWSNENARTQPMFDLPTQKNSDSEILYCESCGAESFGLKRGKKCPFCKNKIR